MVLMVAATVMLPKITGLATYTKNPDYVQKKRERNHREDDARNTQPSVSNTFTYEAPDANMEGDEVVESKTSAFSKVGSKLKKMAHAPNITESDIPIKLELVGENELKRRARKGKTTSTITPNVLKVDPTSFDYDIDEFIDDENERDYRDKQEEAQKKYGMAHV